MATTTAHPAASILPSRVRSGHVADAAAALTAAGYVVHQRAGQLVDVRDQKGSRYLLADGDTAWTLHRRITPTAAGHERNRTDATNVVSVPKNAE